MRLNGSFIWESRLPDWAGTVLHQPSLWTNVTVHVSQGPQTCLWNGVIHFSGFGSSFVDQKHALIAVFYIHTPHESIHVCFLVSRQVQRAAQQEAQRRPAPSSRSFSTTPSRPPRQP